MTEQVKQHRVMAAELDFAGDFLTHSTRASGSGFLKNWRKDGRILIWMHKTAPVYTVWAHSWHRYVEEEDEETNDKIWTIRGQRVNCLEVEKLLKKQKWREKNDHRTVPPEICPLCLCMEWVRAEANAGRIALSAPAFKFETVNEGLPPEMQQSVVLYAGGFSGIFLKKKLKKEEILEMRRTGIKRKEMFMQLGAPRQQYLFTVVSDADLDDGWRLTFETATLGEKLQKAIRDEVKRCGGSLEQGHPRYNPYPFEWSYNENEEFSARYDTVAMTQTKPSPAVLRVLDEPQLDFGKLLDPPALGTLYDSMKEAMQIEMPIDLFFERASKEFGMQRDDESDDDGFDEPSEINDDEPDVESTQSSASAPAADDNAEVADDEEGFECDACGGLMGPDDMECKSCGAKYAQDGDMVVLSERPCANCKKLVKAATGSKCANCGAVHDENWKFTIPTPPPAPAASKSRTGAATTRTMKHSDAKPAARSAARRGGSRK